MDTQQNNTKNWQNMYARLRKFVTQRGSAPAVHDGALGAWVNRQRAHHQRNSLAVQRAAALEQLPTWRW